MAKKDVIIRVTVYNSGLDFGDDVDFILLTVPAELKMYQVRETIESINEEFKKEDEGGECLYDSYGWNATTLMDEVCERNGWSWRFLLPELSFEI